MVDQRVQSPLVLPQKQRVVHRLRNMRGVRRKRAYDDVVLRRPLVERVVVMDLLETVHKEDLASSFLEYLATHYFNLGRLISANFECVLSLATSNSPAGKVLQNTICKIGYE